MARASAAAINAALNGLDGTGSTNTMTHASLHTGDTLTTGASENPATGGYTRQALTMAAAAASSKANSGALAFSTAGTTAVSYAGTWNASSAGTFSIGAALGSSVTATSITIAAGALAFTGS